MIAVAYWDYELTHSHRYPRVPAMSRHELLLGSSWPLLEVVEKTGITENSWRYSRKYMGILYLMLKRNFSCLYEHGYHKVSNSCAIPRKGQTSCQSWQWLIYASITFPVTMVAGCVKPFVDALIGSRPSIGLNPIVFGWIPFCQGKAIWA